MNDYDNVVNVNSALSIILKNKTGKNYTTDFISVKLKDEDGYNDYNLLISYETEKKEEALNAVKEKYKDGDYIELLKPNDNYIQIAWGLSDNYFDNFVTFSKDASIPNNEHKYTVAEVIGDYSDYINVFFAKWYITKKMLGEDIKDDDIIQCASFYGKTLSKRRRKIKEKKKIKTNC